MKKNMKKILIISTVGLIYDGITSVITSYLEAMDKSGLDIYVVSTIKSEAKIEEKLNCMGCKVVYMPSRKENTIKYFLSLIAFIRKNNIDVVHAHGNSGTLAVEMVAAWLGGSKKRIAHSHNTKCNQVKADKILRPIFNMFYTDGLACGEDAGKWLFGNKKFEVLTNGRDIDAYRFNVNKRNCIRSLYNIDKEIVIGHVGGFFEQKNHKFLTAIYKEIRKIEPTCKLFMIGDGPLKNEIETECKGLNVIFTGAIDNVADYLNAMDGMLLPSLFEGLPLVAIEWQINGLPCIFSDAITKECVLTNNVESLSLDCSPKIWAQHIIDMCKSNDREKTSNISYEKLIASKYNLNKNVDRLKQIYIK